MTTVETLENGVDGSTRPTITHDGFNVSGINRNAASSIPVTKASYQTYPLVAGAKTLDLTALEGVENVLQDCSGLKLQSMIITNPLGNSVMTVGEGAVNGYALFGAGNSVAIKPGMTIAFDAPETLDAVSGTDKTIDIAGILVETIDIGMILG
jgi:hypothetical protein